MFHMLGYQALEEDIYIKKKGNALETLKLQLHKWEHLPVFICVISLFYSLYSFMGLFQSHEITFLMICQTGWYLKEYKYKIYEKVEAIYKKCFEGEKVILPIAYIRERKLITWLLSPQENSRSLHLDALRGIAASIVSLGHVTGAGTLLFTRETMEMLGGKNEPNSSKLHWVILNMAPLMVPLFVVMSGYILARVHWTEKRCKDLPRLILGRVTRLFPVHWLCQFMLVSYYYCLYTGILGQGIDILNAQIFVSCLALTHFWRVQIDWGAARACNGTCL